MLARRFEDAGVEFTPSTWAVAYADHVARCSGGDSNHAAHEWAAHGLSDICHDVKSALSVGVQILTDPSRRKTPAQRPRPLGTPRRPPLHMSPAPQRLHLLFTLLLCAALIQLATLVFAAVDHNAAFPGYQEKHACEDELDAETCDSYVYANIHLGLDTKHKK
eukprot:jgi/Tetstr1/433200/TSEL_002382.t1